MRLNAFFSRSTGIFRLAVVMLSTWVFLGPHSVTAGEAFMNGAAAAVFPQRKNRVTLLAATIRIEPLQYPRCYELSYGDRPLRNPGPRYVEFPDSAFATVGSRVDCADHGARLQTLWKAIAHYQLQAEDPDKTASILLAAPAWPLELSGEFEIVTIPTPGFTRINATLNGQPVAVAPVQWIDVGDSDFFESFQTLGVRLTTSIPRQPSELHVEYEFGGEYSTSWDEGREFPSGKPPWFPVKSDAHVLEGMKAIIYLKPLTHFRMAQNAAVRLIVNAPSSLSTTHLVPVTHQPNCVDARSLIFDLGELSAFDAYRITYPYRRHDATAFKMVQTDRLTSRARWNLWSALVGPATLTCDLLDQLRSQADPTLGALLSSDLCRQRCRSTCGH